MARPRGRIAAIVAAGGTMSLTFCGLTAVAETGAGKMRVKFGDFVIVAP
jgi:hypothetical protein